MNKLFQTIQIYVRKIKDDIWWSIPLVHQGWRRVSKVEFKRQYVEFKTDMAQPYVEEWHEKFENDPEKFPVYLVKPRPENAQHICFYKLRSRRGIEFWTREQALDFEKRVAEMQADND